MPGTAGCLGPSNEERKGEHIVDIRHIGEAELEEATDVACRAFGTMAGPEERRYVLSTFHMPRALCAFDEERLIATSTAIPLEVTVPGGVVCSAGGLAWATTLPNYARRGIFRQLVHGQIEDMRRRAEPLSLLTASEGAIYRRFGYGPATSLVTFTVECGFSAFSPHVDGVVRGGGDRIQLLDVASARSVLPPLYDRLRLLYPEQVVRVVGGAPGRLQTLLSGRSGDWTHVPRSLPGD